MKNKILFVIFVLAFLSSAILVTINSSPEGDSGFCLPGEEGKSTCNSVQNSKYAYLFGISNSFYGLFIFAALSILTFMQIRKKTKDRQLPIDTAAIIGFIVAIYFIYLQAFVIEEFCKYCLIIDIGLIIAFALIIQTEIKVRRKKWSKK